VVVQCAQPLARLLATAPGVDEVTTADPPADAAAQAPLLSLMHLFGTRLETIPAKVPYLSAGPAQPALHPRSGAAGSGLKIEIASARASAVQQRISNAPGLKVGLAWGGNADHKNDRNRSLLLRGLAPLFAAEGASFFSLQKGERAAEIAASGLTRCIADLDFELVDFADTAAAITALDLVISVDTAVAHLAGALAKPVWLLLPFVPDWRWLLDRDDSPWYSTMRLYRQPARGDWASVVQRLACDLAGRAARRTATPLSLVMPAKAGTQGQPTDLGSPDSRLRGNDGQGSIPSKGACDRPARSGAGNSAAAEVFAEALCQHRAGRLEEAAALYRRVLSIEPGHVEAHYKLANALHAQARLEEAAASYRRTLASAPRYAEAHNDLGAALAEQGRIEEALASLERALALKPDYADAHNNVGKILTGQDRLEEAAASYRRALGSNPSLVQALAGLASVLQRLGQLDEAMACVDRALAIEPNYGMAHNNRGVTLEALGRVEEAIASFERAIALEPRNAQARFNLGTTQEALGRTDEAMASFGRAVMLDPQNAQAHFNLGTALLRKGDFVRGAAEYEWRWHLEERPRLPPLREPVWHGEALAGRTILLRAEQGFGDNIQFIRYAPLVREHCGRLVVQCAPPLARLLATAPGVDEVTTAGEPPAGIAAHAPLLSLMHLFGTTIETIPAKVPYLAADPARAAAFRQRIGAAANLKVGLAWAGRPTHKNDRDRSLALAQLAPLFATEGVSFFGLQEGARAREIAGVAERIVDVSPDFADFADTAAAIACLDLVISVDTAVAHLAGALAKPVWVLLPFIPDWRWLLEREDSPWYPTMRLYRQPAIGDWASVAQRCAHNLARRAQEIL
jgi:tetratricopeptide (TPR) repeat protein/ADP-heptose:LPS heptosyltransferase